MHALWLESKTLRFRSDLSEPIPDTNEALIRMKLAGICSTDLELVKGYYPFKGVPGHEFVGEVVACPADPSWVGQRVVGEINIVCGQCSSCTIGNTTHCLQRTVLGIKNRAGAFSEYFTLPTENLHRVPDSIPDEVAVFAEPLAAALEIQIQIQFRPTDHVLVVGAGRLGQLIAQSLAHTGCKMQVLARNEKSRNILQSTGIECIVQSQIKPGRADIVVEASGSPEGFKIARKSVRPRGTIVLKSTYTSEMKINMSSIVVDEINLIGSRCGPFDLALRYLEKGWVDPLTLLDGSYSLKDGVEAFDKAARAGVLKVLLKP